MQTIVLRVIPKPPNRIQGWTSHEQRYIHRILQRQSKNLQTNSRTGAEFLGQIVADMTFLLTEKIIEPTTWTDSRGKLYEYYEVEYDLHIIVIGRTLRFEVRSPVDPKQVRDSANFCIAAGFVPGTE